MPDRQCPFYVYESTGWFSSKETCRRTDREISKTTYDTYCNNYESGYSKCPNFKPEADDKGCFITSACVESMGLCDCCAELMCLREFRDTWLSGQPGGKADIVEYYAIAPGIVDAIKNTGDPNYIFRKIYDELVVPCVELIKAEHFEAAWALYRNIVQDLKKRYIAD